MRNINTYTKRTAALAALLAALVSCGVNSGLGPEVDLTPPEVTITSHTDNQTVPNKFSLGGTAYDNEQIASLTIDFEEQNLHYWIENGSWYKTTDKNPDKSLLTEANGARFSKAGDRYEWTLPVDTTEGAGDSGTTYSLKAVIKDKIGNTGRKSSLDMTLIMDENNPNVSVYKPELFAGEYDAVRKEADSYSLGDGNVISRLMNGEVTLMGRQSGSLSFKELRIELDNGKLGYGESSRLVTGDADIQTSVDRLAENVSFAEDEFDSEDGARHLYFKKTLRAGENGVTGESLRNWSVTISPADFEKEYADELSSLGRERGDGRLIRVVSTSLSDSYAWERRVLGYFVWWPEADYPWIDLTFGNETEPQDDSELREVYPAAKVVGNVYDDDGVDRLEYKIFKREDGKWNDTATDSGVVEFNGAKSSLFAVGSPAENGIYKIVLTVTDTNGNSDDELSKETRYFRTLDVSPPQIEFTSPKEDGGSVFAEVNADRYGNITFSGKVTDDGTLQSLEMVYIHPEHTSESANFVRYLSGSDGKGWGSATEAGYRDWSDDRSYYNVIYRIPTKSLGRNEETGLSEYTFEKTLNIFNDLRIDGKERTLAAQYFIFRAVDNGGANTVEQRSLSGDTEAPKLRLDTIELFNEDGISRKQEAFSDTKTPNLPSIKNGDYVVLSGDWSDNSATFWGSPERLTLDVEWLGEKADYTYSLDMSGKFSIKVTSTPASGTVSVSLTDMGANTTKVSKSVIVESANARVDRITSDNDDGSYSANTTVKEISISLNFSKEVRFEGGTYPELILNNDGIAKYVVDSSSTTHKFKYAVTASSKSVERLDVKEINNHGGTWKESNGDAEVEAIVPTGNTLSSRNIKIDNDAPRVKSVRTLTSDGYYNEGSQILIMAEFNENVSGNEIPVLTLGVGTAKNVNVNGETSGSKNILYTYTVSAGENDVLSFGRLSGGDFKDEANNRLVDYSPVEKENFADITIDTTPPAAPTIVEGNNWASVVTAAGGTSFTLSGIEADATAEYATNGENWKTYTTGSRIPLTSNGTYNVRARQTDRAGNQSPEANAGDVKIDIGSLLTNITATTYSGSYKAGSKITGTINFRKAVGIGSGAKVTLNIKNGATNTKEVPIENAGTAAASYTFTYTVVEGDSVASADGLLDVTNWSFSEVTVDSTPVSLRFADAVGEGKRLKDNRQIRILTGRPTVEKVSFSGEDENAVLTVTFDRNITKVGGNITFTHDKTSFRVPAVVSVSEFGSVPSSVQKYYSKGVNGAKLSGNTLTSDTTTKYILDYNKNITDTDLRDAFTGENNHIKEIPVVAGVVTAANNTLTVKLGSTYKLPVKGAEYTLTIQEGAVTDEVGNKNVVYTHELTAEGVEAPTIRIKKDGYTITDKGSTLNANVTLPETASMRIDCRTPGATISYSKNEVSNNTFVIDDVKRHNTISASPTVSGTYISYSAGDVPLGSAAGNNYTALTGIKIAIAAKATKDGKTSTTAYEYAARTVLKFKITENYGQRGNNGMKYGVLGYEDITSVSKDIHYESGVQYMSFLQIWVHGGDAPSGGNTLSTFPLSWGDSTKYKLMKHYSNSRGYKNNNEYDDVYWTGEWAWCTWDLSAPAYHGFVAGDVPTDAENGPKYYFAGECAWTPLKDYYVLYPGESVEMVTTADVTDDGGSNRSQYIFRLKNKGIRK